jgi:hypothetical protein
MESLINLPRDWAITALARAEEQGYLPDSPAEVADGEAVLCAAACIAYAGLKLKRPGHEQQLCSSLSRSRNKQIVVDAYATLGLPPSACFDTMAINDKALPEQRISTLKAILRL